MTRILALAALSLAATTALAQNAPASSDPVALNWVQHAVDAQLYSDAHDIPWMYHEHYVDATDDVRMLAVDTPHGGIHRTIDKFGKPLSPADVQAEATRINTYANDPSAQAKKHKDEEKSDRQAADLLRSWPQAFIVAIASQNGEFITLNYSPNPSYSPPTIEARVMGQMQGQITIKKAGTQIYSVHGRLTHDVSVAFGFVKLHAGGTFQVERREVMPGHWQVVEEHTHIQGHALLLKSISEQEDDWKSDFRPSPAQTFPEAARILLAEHP